MRPAEVVAVADAQSLLPQFLSRLRRGGRDAEPIFIGADGEARGVLISAELFEELSSCRVAVSSGIMSEVPPPPTA
jgi:hypothetical protein